MKTMSPYEFKEFGYLQEVNRAFFHPLGLMLGIKIDYKTNESEYYIQDCRELPEGVNFALSNKSFTTEQRLKYFIDNQSKVQKEWNERKVERLKLLGYNIEPIPLIPEPKESD